MITVEQVLTRWLVDQEYIRQEEVDQLTMVRLKYRARWDFSCEKMQVQVAVSYALGESPQTSSPCSQEVAAGDSYAVFTTKLMKNYL